MLLLQVLLNLLKVPLKLTSSPPEKYYECHHLQKLKQGPMALLVWKQYLLVFKGLFDKVKEYGNIDICRNCTT